MPLIDIDAEVSPGARRWFGLSLGLVLILFGLVLGSWIGGAVGIVGTAVVLIYYLFPLTQLFIIRVWKKATFPLAWIVGHVLLLSVFFGVVLPIGLLLRLCSYDPLQLKPGKVHSGWVGRPGRRPKSTYFRQY